MIAAGLLTDYLTFETPTIIVSPSGARTTIWATAYKCKAYIPRISSKAAEVNHESTYTASVTITVRKVRNITRQWRFLYQDDRYMISDLRYNRNDRTYTIIGERINE